MFPHASPHPLDTDLVDLVEGNLVPSEAARVAAHLDTCLLCRIKRQRLTDLEPLESISIRDLVVPTFGLVETREVPGAEAKPGELWLTSGDEAALVLVRKIRAHAWGLVVVPVTLNVETADSGTLVLDETASPIGTPLAIYEHLAVSLPFSALAERVVPVQSGIDLLSLVEGDPGVSRGTALEGPADPRHEIRQYLVDQLVELDTDIAEDDDNGGSGHAGDPFEALSDDLSFYRGHKCIVEQLMTVPLLRSSPTGWSGFASVKEFGVHIVVVDTPAGLNDDVDFVSGRALLTRLNGSALVVQSPLSETVDLYDALALYSARQVWNGESSSAPIISGLSLRDTLVKYLDQKRRVLTPDPAGEDIAVVDVNEVLAAKAAQALEATAARSPRFSKNEAKKRGYSEVRAVGDDFATALRLALGTAFTPEAIASLIDRTES